MLKETSETISYIHNSPGYILLVNLYLCYHGNVSLLLFLSSFNMTYPVLNVTYYHCAVYLKYILLHKGLYYCYTCYTFMFNISQGHLEKRAETHVTE